MGLYTRGDAAGYDVGTIDRMSLERNVPPWFVDSVNGTNAAGYGRDPDAPLASLAYLLTNASTLGLVAGDHVVLMPEHNEGIANAQIDLDVADIKVYGHPNAIGDRIPIIDFDHANASIDIGADNIYLGHVKLRPSITAVLIGVDIETGITGCTLEDIEFMIGEDGAGVDEFVKAVHLTSGNHDTTLKDLKILAHASAANATHGIHVDAASDRVTYENIIIDGPYATAGILEDAAGTNLVVDNLSINVTGDARGFADASTFARNADMDEQCLEKTADILTGSDNMFIITGGPVLATLTGICTTVIGGASNAKLEITTTEPAATVDLNAGAVAIDTDAAGTSYRNVGATSVFTPVTAGMVIIDPVTVADVQFLLPIGTVKFNNSAAQTGAIKWYLRYKPLSPNSNVTVAA